MARKAPLIAVTGATGFVGRYVLAAALVEGYRIRALTRSDQDISHKNLTWFKGSLGSDDAGLVEDAEAVIHMAGLIKAKKKSDFYGVNAEAAGNLATVAEAVGVKRFVLLSSMAARKSDLSDYAGSKRAGEVAVNASFNGAVAIIRAPAIFGPDDKATKPFFALINKGYLPVPGGKGWRERKLSFAFVDDLAKDLVSRGLSGEYDGKIVSPATEPDINWLEFASACSQAAKKTVTPIPLPLSLLYPVAGITSITSRLLGAGHLTLGKLGEFLYDDWSSGDLIPGATPFIDALEQTMRAYQSPKDK